MPLNAHAILYACFLMQLIFSIQNDLWASAIYSSPLYRLYDLPNKESDFRRRRTDRSMLMNNNGSSSTRSSFETFYTLFFVFFLFFFSLSFFLVLVTLTLSGTLARLFNTRRLGQVYTKHVSRFEGKKKKYLGWFQRLITFVNDVHDPA